MGGKSYPSSRFMSAVPCLIWIASVTFSSVPPGLCVHYLDVVPVKGVASPKVVGAQLTLFEILPSIRNVVCVQSPMTCKIVQCGPQN